LRANERDAVLASVQRVWSHPKLSLLLAGPYRPINERSVLLPDGRTLRPDKVLIAPRETLVLDFKFTHHEDESHVQQVAGYKAALRQLGMPDVKGFIYYGALEKLVAV